MKNLKYSIQFYTNWHCGSGQAAGADVDALVVKDAQGLPFVPGKTIKGLWCARPLPTPFRKKTNRKAC